MPRPVDALPCRVDVDDEGRLADGGERRVSRSMAVVGFAYAAFLIGNDQNAVRVAHAVDMAKLPDCEDDAGWIGAAGVLIHGFILQDLWASVNSDPTD